MTPPRVLSSSADTHLRVHRQTRVCRTAPTARMRFFSKREQNAAIERASESDELRILSMQPDGQAGLSVGSVLRKRIDDIGQAIRDKDVDRLMTFYTSDVTVFDMRPPLDVRGASAYRPNFEKWFASFEGPLGFEMHNLRVVPGESAAFSHYLALASGARPDGGASGYWVRGTTCFERQDGEWRVSHEHISLPTSA